MGNIGKFTSVRALASSLIITLVATAFSPAVTGCSGGAVGATPDLQASQKGTIYYVDDHLGSAQLIADAETGAVYEEVIYPYGLGTESNGEGSEGGADYSYTTKEVDDETGLVYFGKRYYSPQMGRWVSPDPLFTEDPGAVANRPEEGNLYAYVRGNPTSFVDADGDFAIASALGIAFMVAWYILTDPNVANAPAPGEPLIANPTPRERAESYAIDAAVGYLGYRAFKYAFAYARGGGKVVFDVDAASSWARQTESVYHGSITDYKWIRTFGLNSRKTAFVTRNPDVARNTLSVFRDEYVRTGGMRAGVIESRMPKDVFDKYLRASERPYVEKFGFQPKFDSTEIFLDTAEKIEVFNKYIVQN